MKRPSRGVSHRLHIRARVGDGAFEKARAFQGKDRPVASSTIFNASSGAKRNLHECARLVGAKQPRLALVQRARIHARAAAPDSARARAMVQFTVTASQRAANGAGRPAGAP